MDFVLNCQLSAKKDIHNCLFYLHRGCTTNKSEGTNEMPAEKSNISEREIIRIQKQTKKEIQTESTQM